MATRSGMQRTLQGFRALLVFALRALILALFLGVGVIKFAPVAARWVFPSPV